MVPLTVLNISFLLIKQFWVTFKLILKECFSEKIIYSWNIRKDFSGQGTGAVGAIISNEDHGHHVKSSQWSRGKPSVRIVEVSKTYVVFKGMYYCQN